MERRINILKRQGINILKRQGLDVEFYKYPSLGHGFGLEIHSSAKGWIKGAIHFW